MTAWRFSYSNYAAFLQRVLSISAFLLLAAASAGPGSRIDLFGEAGRRRRARGLGRRRDRRPLPIAKPPGARHELTKAERLDRTRVQQINREPSLTAVVNGAFGCETVPQSVPGSVWISAKCWSEWQDLNLRPPRPERGALLLAL